MKPIKFLAVLAIAALFTANVVDVAQAQSAAGGASGSASGSMSGGGTEMNGNAEVGNTTGGIVGFGAGNSGAALNTTASGAGSANTSGNTSASGSVGVPSVGGANLDATVGVDSDPNDTLNTTVGGHVGVSR